MHRRILAVASGGGHWEQMAVLAPSFGDAEVVYVTTIEGLAEQLGVAQSELIPDCNRKF